MKLTKIKEKEISPALARLHAHISGDGCLYIIKSNRSKKELIQHPRRNTKRNRFVVQYCNNDINLLKLFKKDIEEVFDRSGFLDLKQNRVDVQGKRVYELLKYLGAGKSHEWFISKDIYSAPKKVIIAWIKAFFDDEGYVPLKKKAIEVNSVNKKGLLRIKWMLLNLDIDSIVRGPYYTREFFCYRLCINSKNIFKYHNLIGFDSLKKKQRLKDLVE